MWRKECWDWVERMCLFILGEVYCRNDYSGNLVVVLMRLIFGGVVFELEVCCEGERYGLEVGLGRMILVLYFFFLMVYFIIKNFKMLVLIRVVCKRWSLEFLRGRLVSGLWREKRDLIMR